VRFLQRAVLCEVGKAWMTPCGYGADGGGFFDAGHDPHRAAAVAASAHVDVENALEALRPGHRAALFVGAAVVAVGPSRVLVRRRTFAAPRWRQLRAQLRVWRKDAVEAGEVGARWRHQRRQFGDDKVVIRGCVDGRLSAAFNGVTCE